MEDGEHLSQLLEGFDTAMLVTRAADGRLHARPMAVAALRADADAYFVASIDSPKVAEVRSLLANPDKQRAWARHNFEIARERLGYGVLRRKLGRLMRELVPEPVT